MSQHLSLKDKNAIIFGAGGSIGTAVAEEFARQGAQVFLAGRTLASLTPTADRIVAAGGRAHTTAVDALDDEAVERYVADVADRAGRLDVVFNAMGPRPQDYGLGKHAATLSVDEYMVPLLTMVRSNFITSRAAVRRMVPQGAGVILFLTGSPARGHVEGATAIGTAFGALETFMENLAVEVSPKGVRVVCQRTTANVDSRTIQYSIAARSATGGPTPEQIVAQIAGYNWLRTPATIRDTARTAAFLASDQARLFTATVVNASAGAAAD